MTCNGVKEYNQMNVFLPVYFTYTNTGANDLFNIAKLSHGFFPFDYWILLLSCKTVYIQMWKTKFAVLHKYRRNTQ